MKDTLPLGDRSLAIVAVSAVMVGLSILVVMLRCFVRLHVVRAFGWDDGLMIVALALFIALSVLCVLGPIAGIGHRLADFKTMASIQRAMMVYRSNSRLARTCILTRTPQLWWLGQMLYIWASAVSKIAIALALLRLTVRRLHRIILWTICAVIVVIGLMFWLVLLFDCQPVDFFWERMDVFPPKGKCLSVDVLLIIAYVYSSITIVCDITLGVLPACLIWGLQMTRRTKMALCGILSLGAIASVAVVMRLPYLHNYSDTDFLYSTYQIAIYSIMETGLAIIAGSLITLRPLFRWFLDGNSSYRRNHSSGPHGGRNGGKYALTTLTANASKPGSHEPRYWRPDLDREDNTNVVVTSISAPLGRSHVDSSQEDLNPSGSPRHHKNQVSVHQTFMVSDHEYGYKHSP
ncbi:hypothetical protein BJY04DRAFT_231402 [Aspergillus karnatakaensis]|uniref:uncharacterized protein n=1 Tax=Aspergillus karnatakaensis TaxID=1810916 RepID=UPI003CCC98A2